MHIKLLNLNMDFPNNIELMFPFPRIYFSQKLKNHHLHIAKQSLLLIILWIDSLLNFKIIAFIFPKLYIIIDGHLFHKRAIYYASIIVYV